MALLARMFNERRDGEPVLGYAKVAELVKQSLKENRSVIDVIVDAGLMPRDEVEKILDVRALTEPTG